MMDQYDKAVEYLISPPKYEYEVSLPANLLDFVSLAILTYSIEQCKRH